MNKPCILKEAKLKAIKSSGAGGQHVNKVSSKIEINFNVKETLCFSEEEKEILYKNLSTRLTKNKTLLFQVSESRSQHKNKDIAQKRLLKILEKGLQIPKVRKASKPTKASIKKRLEKKKKQAYKKALRQKPSW